MRGKGANITISGCAKGITPACAGKRHISVVPNFTKWDHPRVCGEKPRRLLLRCSLVGSPPRVRGKARAHKQTRTIRRITPACAGKRYCYGLSKVVDRDHPRVCGEKFIHSSLRYGRLGSPPRVRGKVVFEGSQFVFKGITPACAGKSGSRRTGWPDCRDHPRVCGEKCHARFFAASALGSPPRVRGKVLPGDTFSVDTRITPACAGKSGVHPCFHFDTWDHPRVCGEKNSPKNTAAGRAGSPPRVRGKAKSFTAFTFTCGITPACAGKSFSRRACK